jgi:hypothetical protein
MGVNGRRSGNGRSDDRLPDNHPAVFASGGFLLDVINQFLETHWRDMTHQQMGDFLGLTRGAVRNRCWRQGWIDTSNKWTKEQVVALTDLYESGDKDGWIDLKGFSAIIGKHVTNVSRKARSLGLTTNYRRKKPWLTKLPEELSPRYKAKLYYRTLTPEEKTRKLGELRRRQFKKYGPTRGSRSEWRFCPRCGRAFYAMPSEPNRYCSSLCANRARPTMTQFSRAKGGKRADLNNVYFRSSYEANYARYLNFLIEHRSSPVIQRWEFEPDTFEFTKIKKGTRSYTPDFKVYFEDGHIEYHEVKGWDYPAGITARKRLAKYYPHIKLEVMGGDFFKALNRQGVPALIPEWEGGKTRPDAELEKLLGKSHTLERVVGKTHTGRLTA